MKEFAIWLLKKIYGIDVDILQRDNNRLKDENGRHVSRINSLKKDKESLSEKVVHMEEENDSIQDRNQELNKQISRLQEQIKKQKDELNKTGDYKSNISQLNETLGKTQRENAGLKTSLDEAKKEIESLKEQLQTISNPVESSGDDEALDEIENLKRQYASLQELYEQEKKERERLNSIVSKQDSTIDNLKKANLEQEGTIELKLKEIADLGKKLQSVSEEVAKQAEENLIEDEMPPLTVTNDSAIVIEEPVAGNESEQSKDSTKRTIDTVIDLENDKEISAKQFFSQPEGIIFKKRTELEKAIYLQKPMFVCKYCGQMVKISGRKTERGKARFFSHLRDSDDCDYKTTTGRTRREINREKFARCNEGERHKFLKAEIAKYLEMTNDVTDVRIENTVKGNHPVLRWRRPDVIANYRGQEVVFELQLSTTFVSVIVERDLFYRLNQKHIIWISNFDEQGEHVNLTNMMVQDIYYNNRMNLFIFDLDAQRKSEEFGELVLKCNWLKPDGTWQYPNRNTSDELGGKYIRLSDLTFDKTYKPYYVNAEQAYYAAHPEFKIKVASIEEENKEILAELDQQWEKEKEREQNEEIDRERRIQEIIDEYEIDSVPDKKKKCPYIIGQRDGFYGLVTFDRVIHLPFVYDEIKIHKGWIEGKRNGTIEVFTSDYELIDTDIRRIEKLGDSHKKYVKENDGDWLWGIMDKNAKPITLPIFSKVGIWSSDKFIAVKDGQYCILNKSGHIIIAGYDYISELDNECVATISKDGREGRIDSECKTIKSDMEKISDTLSKISKLGKWGLENSDGTILVPCEYDDVGSFNNGIVGLNGIHISQLDVTINADCPVRVKYVSRNERKMLIFKVGNREAFMNLRQQQKAIKNGLKPEEMKYMYFSHANEDKNLLYLSATPVKVLSTKQQINVKDSEIPVGSIIEGSVVHVDKNSFIIISEDRQTAYLHRSMWGKYSMEHFNKGQNVKVVKIGFDDMHKKHIWKILSVY